MIIMQLRFVEHLLHERCNGGCNSSSILDLSPTLNFYNTFYVPTYHMSFHIFLYYKYGIVSSIIIMSEE